MAGKRVMLFQVGKLSNRLFFFLCGDEFAQTSVSRREVGAQWLCVGRSIYQYQWRWWESQELILSVILCNRWTSCKYAHLSRISLMNDFPGVPQQWPLVNISYNNEVFLDLCMTYFKLVKQTRDHVRDSSGELCIAK